jgi:hypothetical protein
MGKAKATTAVAISGLLVVAQTTPAWAGSAAPADPWLHLAIDQPATGQKPARSELAAMPSIIRPVEATPPIVEPPNMLANPDGSMSDVVKSAVGCAVAGSTAFATSIAIGGTNTINVIAGGLVAPASVTLLYLGLGAVIFGSFCQIAMSLMPFYFYATEPAPEAPVTLSPSPTGGSKRTARPAAW